ncbi:MAG: PEP-CTERM system TPR-repeat protein PrsT [Gammaproteobacteria bacterium]|nr:PEP-CTERM system TPR-repeat protein PrsT [Gammaproteobacteria bacterium]MBU1556051.1 PEP-CTERM system TPR-repeat protein PrsT [Gammaproteobacteria bacterium]MBU2069212.1 PEP-CTERM system TPR-repeat protein PrsT [Gammaproteobacteria bacterium]MBU2182307.1 PEP-CTERM system TPR-repeat protein PrsT [Gammaproteobacteria bacterium]MBU2204921.1 PEP-CTERM system TPR-repeat protein PrsT [Gammaproteobacteria bacterium]
MNKKTLLASALSLALLSGCGTKDAAEHYTDALNYINQQQYDAAVIELKSAIQQTPENTEYRFTLGTLYLQIGDAHSAEKELQRALAGGKALTDVGLPLIRATYLTTDYAGVLALFADTPAIPSEIADYVTLYKAMAELELGSVDDALNLFSSVADSEKAGVAAYAQANLLIPQSKYQDALDLLESVTQDYPHQQEALYLKANLLIALTEDEKAYTELNNYIKLQPRQFKARLQAAQLAVKLEKYNEAKSQLKTIFAASPDQPLANYLAAVTAMHEEDYTAAKEYVEKALNKGYRTTQARILAAVTSIKLGLESQALHHLTSIEQHLHGFPQLQRIYIALQLKENKTDSAQQELLDMQMSDEDIRLVAGTALNLVKQGNNAAARELIAKYESSMSDAAQSLSAVGQLKMSIPGEELAAIRDLEQALLLAPDMHQTRLVLVASYLKNNQFDQAEQLADTWLAKPETANLGYNVKAYSSLLQKNIADAEQWLNKATEAEADNPLTLMLQAAIAEQQNNKQLAAKLTGTILQKAPDYIPAIRLAYMLAKEDNNTAAVLDSTKKAAQANPGNYVLRLTLARMLLTESQFTEASKLLEQQPPILSDRQASHWVMLIDLALKQNKPKDALRISQSWFEQQPNIAQPGLTYANLLLRQQLPQDALRTLNLLKNNHAGHVQLTLLTAAALEMLKQYDAALAEINSLPASVSDTALTLALKGRLLLLLEKPAPALEALLGSYDKEPVNSTATLIADLYAKEYSLRKGIEFIEQHIAKTEPTEMLMSYYANMLVSSDPQKSQQIYSTLLNTYAENFILLNNYAWLLLQNKNYAEAITYAEKAIALAPDNPDVLDTYGAALLRTNKTAEALIQLEKAYKLKPDSTDIKLIYAEALLTAKRSDEARVILDTVNSADREVKRKVEALQQRASN